MIFWKANLEFYVSVGAYHMCPVFIIIWPFWSFFLQWILISSLIHLYYFSWRRNSWFIYFLLGTVAHRISTVIDSDMVMVLSSGMYLILHKPIYLIKWHNYPLQNSKISCIIGEMMEYDAPSKLMESDSYFSKLVAEYWSICRTWSTGNFFSS